MSRSASSASSKSLPVLTSTHGTRSVVWFLDRERLRSSAELDGDGDPSVLDSLVIVLEVAVSTLGPYT